MNVGEIVRTYRIKRCMTMEQLGRTVGVSGSMIAQIERGTKALTVQLGKQLAEALEVDAKVLFGLV